MSRLAPSSSGAVSSGPSPWEPARRRLRSSEAEALRCRDGSGERSKTSSSRPRRRAISTSWERLRRRWETIRTLLPRALSSSARSTTRSRLVVPGGVGTARSPPARTRSSTARWPGSTAATSSSSGTEGSSVPSASCTSVRAVSSPASAATSGEAAQSSRASARSSATEPAASIRLPTTSAWSTRKPVSGWPRERKASRTGLGSKPWAPSVVASSARASTATPASRRARSRTGLRSAVASTSRSTSSRALPRRRRVTGRTSTGAWIGSEPSSGYQIASPIPRWQVVRPTSSACRSATSRMVRAWARASASAPTSRTREDRRVGPRPARSCARPEGWEWVRSRTVPPARIWVRKEGAVTPPVICWAQRSRASATRSSRLSGRCSRRTTGTPSSSCSGAIPAPTSSKRWSSTTS